MNLMTKKQDKINKENFKSLLNSFFYSRDTIERIENIVDHNFESDSESFIHNHLNLESDDRIFVEMERNKRDDDTYNFYLHNLITCNIFSIERIKAMAESLKMRYEQLYEILNNYDTFISGRIKLGNTELKLFKSLLKYKILNAETVNTINKSKANTKKLYLCISKNPIDYLFCATNQSFTSCENLESDYYQSLYLGLPASIVDPNRCIVFITNGKLHEYTIKGKTFKHFNYIQRTWAILCKRNIYTLIRHYPNKKTYLENHLRKYFNIRVQDFNDVLLTESKFEFYLPSYNKTILDYENGNAFPFVYLDYFGIQNKHFLETGRIKELMYYPVKYYFDEEYENSFVGSSHNRMEFWSFGFEKLLKPFELYEDQVGLHYTFCNRCNTMTGIDPPNTRITREDGATVITQEDGTNEVLCNACFSREYFICERCGKINKKPKIPVEVHTLIPELRKSFSTFNYCKDCIKEATSKCPVCKRLYTNKENKKCMFCLEQERVNTYENTN